VDRHQEGRHQRQEDDVQGVEANQGALADLKVAAKHQVHLLADQWCGAADLRADCDCPKGQLIPGQQVAGKGEQERRHEQQDADNPVELAGRFI
jgi:hypothetical protein